MELAIAVILRVMVYYLIFWCVRSVFRFGRSLWRGEGLVITPRDHAFIDALGFGALVAWIFSRRDS